eukprot:TRINITY_DN38287_c0_g1_i1.p1 TRINITY_DN38287_c0_g1~~TRINITY_DN38287_c0_g1_i1.p1  ORF type:complete len:491 (+),score=34.54 TRINITY_DN38287_c0_g1_i1:176-1474(+)
MLFGSPWLELNSHQWISMRLLYSSLFFVIIVVFLGFTESCGKGIHALPHLIPLFGSLGLSIVTDSPSVDTLCLSFMVVGHVCLNSMVIDGLRPGEGRRIHQLHSLLLPILPRFRNIHWCLRIVRDWTSGVSRRLQTYNVDDHDFWAIKVFVVALIATMSISLLCACILCRHQHALAQRVSPDDLFDSFHAHPLPANSIGSSAIVGDVEDLYTSAEPSTEEARQHRIVLTAPTRARVHVFDVNGELLLDLELSDLRVYHLKQHLLSVRSIAVPIWRQRLTVACRTCPLLDSERMEDLYADSTAFQEGEAFAVTLEVVDEDEARGPFALGQDVTWGLWETMSNSSGPFGVLQGHWVRNDAPRRMRLASPFHDVLYFAGSQCEDGNGSYWATRVRNGVVSIALLEHYWLVQVCDDHMYLLDRQRKQRHRLTRLRL